MGKPFDLVLGRKTYEIFAAHWPNQSDDDLGAKALNSATKNVASTTLTELGWENSRLIEPDVPSGVRTLKEQDGPELQVHGSADLIQTLLEHDLIDEFRAADLPGRPRHRQAAVRRGTVPGRPGARALRRQPLGRRSSATYRTGAEIRYGSFAAEDPSDEELARREKQQG